MAAVVAEVTILSALEHLRARVLVAQ